MGGIGLLLRILGNGGGSGVIKACAEEARRGGTTSAVVGSQRIRSASVGFRAGGPVTRVLGGGELSGSFNPIHTAHCTDIFRHPIDPKGL